MDYGQLDIEGALAEEIEEPSSSLVNQSPIKESLISQFSNTLQSKLMPQ